MENMNSRYSLSPETAVIGSNGLALNSGWITVYHAGPDGEYTGASNDYLMWGVGLAAGAYADAPELPTEPGKAVRRSADKTHWEIVVDHRGKTAWNTMTREPVKITFMGEIPSSLTLTPPSGEFDKWDGEKWIPDNEAKKAAAITEAENKKRQLMTDVLNKISIWQTQLQMSVITDENKARLTEWLNYYNALDAIKPDCESDIVWPDMPHE
ncbi:tail fiber assembly protein [Salmonella enterica subsp. enterica serovar Newport]|nr:tail fiber assembly protein [Salmonella enterica subsp. enterica serovar Newport]